MQIVNRAHPGSTMRDRNGISGHLIEHGRTAQLSTELNDKNGYRKTPEHEFYTDVDDFSSSNEKEAKDSVAASVVHTELSHKDSNVYTDKDILESDLPELIVCYKDSIFHAVKDICVDEGVPTENKCLTENVVGGRSTLPSNNYKHRDVVEEADIDILYVDGFKSASYKDFRADAAADCVNKSEVDIDKDTAYDSDAAGLESLPESDKYQDFASVRSPESSIQTGAEKSNAVEKTTEIVCGSTLLGKDLSRQTSLKCLLESSKCGENDGSQGSNEISGAQGPVISEELNKTSHLDNLLCSGELERGIIIFDVDSSKLAPSTREIHENAIGQEHKSENKLIHDDGILENLLVINNQIKHCEGESSFSVAGRLSDVVPYSGHIPFSGSISLRSDSSTTSTRSFAFPVLLNEWNSSPVRMAKADRRHLRKHRGCNLGLLCCRF